MDLLRNFISQLHKSLQKTDTASNNRTGNATGDILLNKPVGITESILQSNVAVEVSITEKMDACQGIKIVKELNKEDLINTDGKNILHTGLNTHDSESCKENVPDLSLFEMLLNNSSISITKVNNKVKTVDSESENSKERKDDQDVNKSFVKENNQHGDDDENEQCNGLNNSFGIVVNDPPLINKENEDNGKKKADNIMKEVDIAQINEANKTTHSTNSVQNPTDNLTANLDVTRKCIKEFDEVLAEVQKNDNFQVDNAEALSLEDIDDILKEELEDDNTYNFQEITHANDLKTVNKSNSKAVGHLLETMITKLYDEASKTASEDNIDIISISSDESNTEEALSTRTHIETKQDNTKEKVEDAIEIISLSSEDSVDADEIITQLKATQSKSTEKIGEAINQFDLSEVTQDMDVDKDNEQKEIQTMKSLTVNADAKSDTDDDCGYHSSDFEFISEEEAKIDGFIINFDPKRHIGKNAQYSNKINNPYGAGPSGQPKRYGNYKRRKEIIKDKSYKENYAVPEEKEFLEMFHGIIPAMPPCEIHFLENKSIRTRAPMLVQYEGIGFDMNLAMQRRDSSDDEYRDEAEGSLKKILEMYPIENSKRKRRLRK